MCNDETGGPPRPPCNDPGIHCGPRGGATGVAGHRHRDAELYLHRHAELYRRGTWSVGQAWPAGEDHPDRRRRCNQRGDRGLRRFRACRRLDTDTRCLARTAAARIANTAERNIVAITMRKEIAEAAGFDAKAPLEKRAAALRGRTFGVGAINANPHAYLLAVASHGGVKPDELRVTALEGNAMWAAFQSKQIDGMSNSPPWPLKPVVDGLSVVVASGPDGDPPNAVNFAYNVVLAKP